MPDKSKLIACACGLREGAQRLCLPVRDDDRCALTFRLYLDPGCHLLAFVLCADDTGQSQAVNARLAHQFASVRPRAIMGEGEATASVRRSRRCRAQQLCCPVGAQGIETVGQRDFGMKVEELLLHRTLVQSRSP